MMETMAFRQHHSHLPNALAIAMPTETALVTWPASNEMAQRLFQDVQGLEHHLRTIATSLTELLHWLTLATTTCQPVPSPLETVKETAIMMQTALSAMLVFNAAVWRRFLDALD
jgi:hypothetical protein